MVVVEIVTNNSPASVAGIAKVSFCNTVFFQNIAYVLTILDT